MRLPYKPASSGDIVETLEDAEVSEVRIEAMARRAEETTSMVGANRMSVFAASRRFFVSYTGQLGIIWKVACKNASLRSPSESGVYAKTHELHCRAAFNPAYPSITSPTTRLDVLHLSTLLSELESAKFHASLTLAPSISLEKLATPCKQSLQLPPPPLRRSQPPQ
jgi:hypothetical protein